MDPYLHLSVDNGGSRPNNHRGKDPYVTHFVDDEGFPPNDPAEMAQLAAAFRDGYDGASRVASTNAAGFVTSLGVIPSLEKFMEGRERVFY